jgi:hypothetical protein
MKTLLIVSIGALLFATSGCTSTVALGAGANEDKVIGASASTDGVSITLPLVKLTTSPTSSTKEKKK